MIKCLPLCAFCRNMFLAAAPYFGSRFAGNKWIEENFQSTILTVSTITSLLAVLILTNIQRKASYPFRINLALIINTVVFALLTASTSLFLDASPNAYFAFVLVMVASTSWATGLLQNGALAFASSFGRPEYMQSLVAGQGLAGILPALTEVVSVLMFPAKKPEPGDDEEVNAAEEGKTSAFIYFLAAVVISVIAMAALLPLVRRHANLMQRQAANAVDESINGIEEAELAASRKVTSMPVLFSKLRWLATGIALVFTATMFFPVFTQKIVSVRSKEQSVGIFASEAFVPLAFFFWNLGDFSGRIFTAAGNPIGSKPLALFLFAMLRIVQVPLYLLCNIRGNGAIVPSDFFYLFIVQLPFGLTNGWLCSRLMTSAGSWVDTSEREAAGGFMGLCLIIGLTAGSLLSFTVNV